MTHDRSTGGGRHRDFRRPDEDPPGTSRLFIAVPVSDEVRASVGRLMEAVAGGPVDERKPGGLRWVRVEGLHLTLRFLGATPDARQAELAEAIERVADGIAQFDVVLAGGGAFPTPQRPRVLWLAIREGADRLGVLADRAEAELERLGWTRDERGFRPHLTLARSDGVPGAADAVARLVSLAEHEEYRWRADRVVLYRSHLGRGGSRYESLAEAPLEA